MVSAGGRAFQDSLGSRHKTHTCVFSCYGEQCTTSGLHRDGLLTGYVFEKVVPTKIAREASFKQCIESVIDSVHSMCHDKKGAKQLLAEKLPYQLLLIELLPRVVGQSIWERHQRLIVTSGETTSERDWSITKGSTANDEAFLVLALENYWERWFDAAEHHDYNAKLSTKMTKYTMRAVGMVDQTSGGGGTTAQAKEQRQNKDRGQRYSSWDTAAFRRLREIENEVISFRTEVDNHNLIDALYKAYQNAGAASGGGGSAAKDRGLSESEQALSPVGGWSVD